MITGQAGEKEETLTVSWASLEKRESGALSLTNPKCKDIAGAFLWRSARV